MANTLDKVSLPKLLEVSEKALLPDNSSEQVILQPKFDGCQAIFVPGVVVGRCEPYLAVTRKGQVIPRLQPIADALPADLGHVLFCEYEPSPWSEEAKVKLAGNLYTDTALPFNMRLVIFDGCRTADFLADNHRQGSCKARLQTLDALKPALFGERDNLVLSAKGKDGDVTEGSWVEISISPWQEMPYAQAKELCASSNRETPQGTRCKVLGIWCEGGVIRHGSKAEKVKAKLDQDVIVLEAVQSAKGQRGWIVADTKNPSDIFPVFGGVPQEFAAHVGSVVEVTKLVVTGFKGAGNPTFSRSRANEKEFDPSIIPATAIAAVRTQYKLSPT